MAAIQADPDVLADLDLAPFTKVRGESSQMRVGDRYVIEITARGRAPSRSSTCHLAPSG